MLYDNRDLYRDYSELKYRIGLVPQQDIMHTQLSARRALRYAAELRFPQRHQRPGAEPAGRRGHRRARADPARQHPGRIAVRRPAQAGQRRAGAAHQALAAVPGRADLRPGPRARQVGDGDDGRAGPRRPHGHRGHAQRRQPRPVRPPAGAGARRQGGVLRAAARGPDATSASRAGPRCSRRSRPSRTGTGPGSSSGPRCTRSTSPRPWPWPRRRPGRGRPSRLPGGATAWASSAPCAGATWPSSRPTGSTSASWPERRSSWRRSSG